jgi:hypothetical protein
MDDQRRAELVCTRELIARELPQGGWPFHSNAAQAAVEATALTLLALPRTAVHERERAIRFLLQIQNPNGSWPAFQNDDSGGSGFTGLVVYALSRAGAGGTATNRAIRWLLQSRGWESHWLWRWKFRTTDRHVRFDPDKFGWPWMAETASWVVPTSYSLLALKKGTASPQEGLLQFRFRRGVEMLYDRICPQGGWNAGNGVVYGVSLAPHLDATSIALLALHGAPPNDLVTASLDWLENCAQFCSAPWSLAWAIVALAAFRRATQILIHRLAGTVESDAMEDCATLAVASLALHSTHGRNTFGANS